MTETPHTQTPDDDFSKRAAEASRGLMSDERRRKRRDAAILAGTLIVAAPAGAGLGLAASDAIQQSEDARQNEIQKTFDESREAFEAGLESGKITLDGDPATYDEFLQENGIHFYEPSASERDHFEARQPDVAHNLPIPQQGNPNPTPERIIPTPKTR